MTAVAEWLGLWCMELWVLGSSLASDFDLFFFSFFSFFPLSKNFWRAVCDGTVRTKFPVPVPVQPNNIIALLVIDFIPSHTRFV